MTSNNLIQIRFNDGSISYVESILDVFKMDMSTIDKILVLDLTKLYQELLFHFRLERNKVINSWK